MIKNNNSNVQEIFKLAVEKHIKKNLKDAQILYTKIQLAIAMRQLVIGQVITVKLDYKTLIWVLSQALLVMLPIQMRLQ